MRKSKLFPRCTPAIAEACGGPPAAPVCPEALPSALIVRPASFPPNWHPLIRDGGLLREVERSAASDARRALEDRPYARLRLPGGRQVTVHYEPNQPPWIASRLQDFFGMRETPTVARGAVPVVVRLLAPNQRPVQMTTDLAGFWQHIYPQIR